MTAVQVLAIHSSFFFRYVLRSFSLLFSFHLLLCFLVSFVVSFFLLFFFFNTLVLNLTFTGMLKVSADEFEEETARDEVTPT